MSRARRSVSLPFPSSPHCVPTTTVAGTTLLRKTAPDYVTLYPDQRRRYSTKGEAPISTTSINGDDVAVGVATFQERHGQLVLHRVLEHPPQGPRPQVGV